MNPNNITKWFFASRKLICPQCDEKSFLRKSIHIYGSVPHDDDYVMACYWDYDTTQKKFTLGEWGNSSPDNHNILLPDHSLTSISDLRATCYLLTQSGYKIDEVRLIVSCDDGLTDNKCRFSHKYELEWFSDSNSLLLEEEWAKLSEYKIHKHYGKDNSCIIIPYPNTQIYDFDFVLNLDLKEYKSLKTKIQQILLLG